MRLIPQFLPGDEFLVRDLLSSILFTPDNLVTSYGVMDDTSSALRYRTEILPFYVKTITTLSTYNHSDLLCNQTVNKIGNLYLTKEENTSMLPLEYDWLMLPAVVLNNSISSRNASDTSTIDIKVSLLNVSFYFFNVEN